MGINVNIEVSVKLESRQGVEVLREAVEKEIRHRSVHSGLTLDKFKSELLTDNLVTIRVCEMFSSSSVIDSADDSVIIDDSAILNIYPYRLSDITPEAESIGGEEDTLAANFLPLPAKCLEGLWETLVYDSKIKQELLQYSRAMLHYSKCKIDPNVINCNRVLLLHGPPGTGKTSLSKAVAQKLSIRLNSTYSQALLIEINTHSLFSKYFSESGKLVSKMFEKIKEIAYDPNTLLCVLIDEVESLTHSRSASSQGSEPSDAIRVVNAVLTHLDLLKGYSNVLTLTTSNVTNAIDIAFVDRADLRVLIPNPSPFGIYAILHSCLEELIKRGLLLGPCPPRITNRSDLDPENPDGAQRELIILCKKCEGLSGRTLRKLPLRVHSTAVQPEVPSELLDFVRAMSAAADQTREELKNFDSSNVVLS